MTEAARIYHQDVAAKSRLKNNVHHKKGGSAVSKLGNKEYSAVEILEKNGPCITYPSTDNFMEFSDFERLSPELKIEFVNKMCDKYDINIKHISKILFNKGDDGLRAHLRNHKIRVDDSNGCTYKLVSLYSKCNPDKPRAKSMLLRFENDVAEWKLRNAYAKEQDKAQAKMKQEALPPLMTCDEFKKMTMNDRIFYINSLIETYQVSSTVISTVLFKKSSNWIANHFGRFNRNKEIVKLPRLLTNNAVLRHEHESYFKKLVEAWEDFSDDPIDISPAEEPKPVKEEKMIEKAPEVPEVKKLPPDEEFELEGAPIVDINDPEQLWDKAVVEQLNPLATNKTFDPFAEEEPEVKPELEPEVDPFAYHEMHFSIECIRVGFNMEEFYTLVELCKNKRIKYRIEVTEV